MAALTAGLAVTGAAPPSSPPVFGVQFHGLWNGYWAKDGKPLPAFGYHLDTLRAHGVGLIRVDIGWSASEPKRGVRSPSHWYNRRLPILLSAATERGMKVLATIHQSPAWSRPSMPAKGSDRRFPDDPESIRPWARWMAETYGKQVYAWEVWNEPNLEDFTGIKDLVRQLDAYVPLLKACSAGLRAGDPSAVVVLGGTCYTDHEFIGGVYDRDGRDHFDVLALHPYLDDQTKDPWEEKPPNRFRMTHFPAVAEVMRKHGDGTKPVWWTEFGFTVHPRNGVPDAATAGRSLVRSFELARQRYPQVRLGVVYTTFRPLPPEKDSPRERGYHLMNANGTAMPQLPSLRDYFARHPAPRPLL